MRARDTADLVGRPPLIFLASILVGLTAHWLRPMAVVAQEWAALLGVPIVLAAITLFVSAVVAFRRAGTPVQSVRPTTRIVTTGPYRLSRNPIYLAFTLFHFGIGLWINSVWVLAALLLTLIVMTYGVIVREERYLEQNFGDEYRRYKAAVRRWL